MKKLFAPLLLAFTALLLGGCINATEVATRGLSADVVSLQRAKSGEIRVTWVVRNPNVVSYVLPRAVLRVSLDGAPVGTITDESRIGLPAQNQAERTSVLVPNGPAGSEIIAAAIAKGTARYDLEATVWMLLYDEKTDKFTLRNSGTARLSTE